MISSPIQVGESSQKPCRLGPNELTPVQQRTSRHLRGEPAEFPLLPEPATVAVGVGGVGTTMTSHTAATHVVAGQPQMPQPSHGNSYEDAEEFLEGFERVTDCNG